MSGTRTNKDDKGRVNAIVMLERGHAERVVLLLRTIDMTFLCPMIQGRIVHVHDRFFYYLTHMAKHTISGPGQSVVLARRHNHLIHVL